MQLRIVLAACLIGVAAAPGQTCTGAIELVSKLADGATTIAGIGDISATIGVKQVTGSTELIVPLENGMTTALADSKGSFAINLANPLAAGQHLRIYQVTGSGISCIDAVVTAPGDLGRIRFYFTGGEVVSRDSGFKSDSTLYLAFNVDKNWKWGGRLDVNPADRSYQWAAGFGNRVLWNTFFETRLTSVPEAQADPTASSLAAFIGSRKSALMQAGNYFPILINHWTARGSQNSMFIAPLATVGFIAPTSAASPAPLNPAPFYNQYGYGIRLGHFKLAESNNLAPELISSLDVICGRFSNLETMDAGGRPSRQYRFAIEGAWTIPSTPFQLGFSANVGQSLHGIPGRQAPGDDLRFFFGARFDVSKLLGQFQQLK